jgi:hypothetical protein
MRKYFTIQLPSWTLTSVIKSELPVVRSVYAAAATGPWASAGKFDIVNKDSRFASNMQFQFLQNPTITAFPKTPLKNSTLATTDDADPAIVQKAFWENQRFLPSSTSNVTMSWIFARQYSERQGGDGNNSGSWVILKPTPYLPSILHAGWPQYSFGVYNEGPAFDLTAPIGTITATGSAYLHANKEGSEPGTFTTDLRIGSIGSYKGTYDSLLGVEEYLNELRSRDSSYVEYVFGGVYVGDTSISHSMRQVRLCDTTPDSTYTSASKLRDSLFRTSLFDFPNGAVLKFFRGSYFGDSLSILSGGNLYDSSAYISYKIELVFSDGTYTVVDSSSFCPARGHFIVPKLVQISNGSGLSKDVYLRVRANSSGYPSDDAHVLFSREVLDTAYITYEDTSFILYKRRPASQLSVSDGLLVSNPYPNPVELHSKMDIVIQARFVEGSPMKVDLLDVLGRVLISKTVQSTGDFQDLTLTLPGTNGTYLVRVRAGNAQIVKPICVTK